MNNDNGTANIDDWTPEPLATDRAMSKPTKHKGHTAMQSNILHEKLDAAAAACAALRRAQYDAACARHELTVAVLQSVIAGDLPDDVLTVNATKLRRSLFTAR